MNEDKSVFETLSSIDCNSKVEKKNGLNYLSWAYAWGELLKAYPDSTFKVYENKDGWNYFTDGKTAWVKTGVTVKGVEHIEYLPVMDYRNKSISLASITSYDVNKAIQRSITKAIARHGLGLYIYAGEDLPEDAQAASSEYVDGMIKVINDAMKSFNAEQKAFAEKAIAERNADNLKYIYQNI